MPEYQKLVDLIATRTGTKFRAASESDLAELRTLRLPDPVLSFFARHEPSRCAEGQVRLLPIANILQENIDLMPGACVSPLGYVAFSTTFCGDAYCFDVNMVDQNHNPRIVLFSHEAISEDITAEEAARLAKPVAMNLCEFLEQFIDEQLDEECLD